MPLPLAIVAGAALIGGASIFSTIKSGQMQEKALAQSKEQNDQMMQLVQQQRQESQQNLPLLMSLLQQSNQQNAMLSQYTGFQMPPQSAQVQQWLQGQMAGTPGAAGQVPLPGGQPQVQCTCGGHGPPPAYGRG